MSKTVDTSVEAVEQLAMDYDVRVTCQPDRVCKVQRAVCCFCVLTAATLRALLAERDAALSQCRAVVENGLRFQAERDAARAEAARLRRLWTYMQEAAADPDADEPLTAAEWLAEFADAEAKTRATLAAKEPGHE